MRLSRFFGVFIILLFSIQAVSAQQNSMAQIRASAEALGGLDEVLSVKNLTLIG